MGRRTFTVTVEVVTQHRIDVEIPHWGDAEEAALDKANMEFPDALIIKAVDCDEITPYRTIGMKV